MSLSDDAVAYVKANRKQLIERFADPHAFPPVGAPETIFMAGSPGAGKTEWSRNFLRGLPHGSGILRIDPDDIRAFIPGYTGNNSDEVQGAASLAVQKILDNALKIGQSFVFDGTFARYDLAQQNISRCIKHSRHPIVLFYIHHDPLVAWDVTKARELREGRSVPKDTFIHAYFASRENVNQAKAEFGDAIRLYLVDRNADASTYGFRMNIDSVDNFLKLPYTRESLKEKLK